MNEPEDPSYNECNFNFGQLMFCLFIGFFCGIILSLPQIDEARTHWCIPREVKQ